ncbi:MAG: hypothetical protein M0C28_31760 [Candidatus Moduliflexus flocculans]|nr:hypothetical protein [Candidatus Moduliflexus flocculans]
MGLMVKACWDALHDAKSTGLRDLIDRVYVINLFQWPLRDAPEHSRERARHRCPSEALPAGGRQHAPAHREPDCQGPGCWAGARPCS